MNDQSADGAGVTGEPAADVGPLVALAEEQARLRADLEKVAAAVMPLLSKQYADTQARVRALENKIRARQERPVVARLAGLLNDVTRLTDADEVRSHVIESLHGLLTELGYQTFGAVGDFFDPTWHEALAGGAGDRTVVTRVHARGLSCFGDVMVKAKVEVQPVPAGDEREEQR